MIPRNPRFGLCVSVRLNGVVVGQTVHWPRRFNRAVLVGRGAADAIPTADDGPLLRARWVARDRVQLEPLEPSAPAAELGAGQSWHWTNGHGVDVDLDLVSMQRARRRPTSTGGDIALLTLVLTLMLTVSQVRFVLERFLLLRGAPADTTIEPSPELIARLLEKDYGGADDGVRPPEQEPDYRDKATSYYLPAGNDGPLNHAGGGRNAGRQVRRTDPSHADRMSAERPEGRPGDDAIAQAIDSASRPLVPDGEPDPGLEGAETRRFRLPNPADELVIEDDLPQDLDPVERFIGWGFLDWFDVQDARRPVEQSIRQELALARERLRIDPDDAVAIQILGYYAYLAQNMKLCRKAYKRYVRLYPDDAAGYNNLALCYKRTGDYRQEEALYRKALAMKPLDPHVLNNLAVNLAHQGRYDEALRIMALLEKLDPDDPYADLHRAKIYAAMGRRRRAYRYLKQALDGSGSLDTLHHIEFRQDIRVDPAFDSIRHRSRFARLLRARYGQSADHLLGRSNQTRWGDHG